MSLNQPVLQSKTHLNKSKTIIQKKKKTDNPGIRILNMGQNKGLQDNSEENARVLTCQAKVWRAARTEVTQARVALDKGARYWDFTT